MMKIYNSIANKSKCDWGEILGKSICGSMPAEKLCHVKKKIYIILLGKEFSSPPGNSLYQDGLCPAPTVPMH